MTTAQPDNPRLDTRLDTRLTAIRVARGRARAYNRVVVAFPKGPSTNQGKGWGAGEHIPSPPWRQAHYRVYPDGRICHVQFLWDIENGRVGYDTVERDPLPGELEGL